MVDLEEDNQEVDWVTLLNAYAQGIFPMADPDDGQLYWYSPDPRAILPLREIHFSRSFLRFVKKCDYRVTYDRCFREVMLGCAEPRKDEDESWINDEIVSLYCDLFERGYAHSVEAWAGEELVGGLYGVSIGSGFFAESMFSRRTNASKFCLYHLTAKLVGMGFDLFDVQFQNDHIKQFGVVEIPRDRYWQMLEAAVSGDDLWGMGLGE